MIRKKVVVLGGGVSGLSVAWRLAENGFKVEVFEKWESFGWNTKEIDGHNIDDLIQAFKDADDEQIKPSCIIAHTIKGKGVSFMEDPSWHAKVPTEEQYEQAIKELGV